LPHQECLKLIRAVRVPVIAACFACMYACGLRIFEARALKTTAIDAKRHVLRIIGKGNKERLVTLPESLLLELRRVWSLHRNPVWVFAKHPTGNPISITSLSRALADAAKAAGLPRVGSHVFRHSFATRLLEREVGIEKVQILLGHEDPKTTRTYLHLTEPVRDRIRAEVEGFSADIFRE
jgi:integrase